MRKYVALLLIAAALLTLAACGSKDALTGTWSAELGADGVISVLSNLLPGQTAAMVHAAAA